MTLAKQYKLNVALVMNCIVVSTKEEQDICQSHFTVKGI